MALGLTLGIVIAVSGGSNTTKIHQSAAAAQGNTSSAVNTNCDIIVPAHPLSARGLATPYQLTGMAGTTPQASGCEMTNSINLGAFVQATILDPRTGALSVYNPLVITAGTKPAVAPKVPKLPRNAVVTIDFGFNGTFLYQKGATAGALQEGNCVDGLNGSAFGQVSFCNGINFFRTAYRLESEGRLSVPSAGTSAKIVPTAGALGTGNSCPTVRNFDMVDQDQSDNVTSIYLLNSAGQTAQATTANTAALAGAQKLVNGSDNALIDDFLDQTLGCTPFMAPDLGNNGVMTTSQALDELLAARNQPRVAALVPESDEMTLDTAGQIDLAKTDLYRAEVGQAPVSAATNKNDSPANYCQNLTDIQAPFLAANEAVLNTDSSPVPTVGEDLFTFLANRLNMSFTNLNCQSFGLTNPVTVVLDGGGAATSATFNTAPQTASITGGAGVNPGAAGTGAGAGTAPAAGGLVFFQAPGGAQHVGRDGHLLMDPSGA